MAATPSATFLTTTYSLVQCFQSDPRPTLVIDVSDVTENCGVQLEHANDAFTEQYGVLLRFILSGQIFEPDFIEWLKSSNSSTTEYALGDLRWSFFILDKKWKVVYVTPTWTTAHGYAKHPSSSSQTVSLSSKRRREDSEGPMQIDDWNQERRKSNETMLTVDLPSGLVTSGAAPTALEGLHRSVEMLDVGFFEYDLEGTLIFANKSWYALSGHPYDPKSHTQMRFMDLCHPDDADTIRDAWNTLLSGKPITFEMRWKRTSTPSSKALGAQWVLAACIPNFDSNMRLKTISGCTTDINNQKLSAQIAQSKAEALERARTFEQRFERFASVASIVIFHFDANQKMTYCNHRWFEMTHTDAKTFEKICISEGLLEEDIAKWFSTIDAAVTSHEVKTDELRLRKEWHASDGVRAQAWVLASIFAEFTENGALQGCTGTLTDISESKYAESMQRIRLDNALEAKRQQENFIDMTSHEMRNPLSAMIQCADSALDALNDGYSLLKPRSNQESLDSLRQRLGQGIQDALDAIQTIMSCCAHQKCIIDDVLTLSKLDSNLLVIAPVRVEPLRVMSEAVKMFDMDAQKTDVKLLPEIDQSVKELQVDWLMMDPSRVKQILINLISNAIKFTRTQDTRSVTLRMSAFLQSPATKDDFEYSPALRLVSDDLLTGTDWETGEVIYLHFSIQDTGRGMNGDEIRRLFHRFSQASPKTYVEYGGSGLGLFITRQLIELHGGEIGVKSEERKGSTFAFYIRTRRTKSDRLPPPLPSPNFQERTAVPVTSSESLPQLTEIPDPILSSEPSMEIPLFDWRPSVLVVEDNMVNRQVLSNQLKKLGCKVAVAGHGQEALEFLKASSVWHGSDSHILEATSTIDIILMDVEMPVMGGLECTREIRKLEQAGYIRRPQPGQLGHHDGQHHQLPIISISANARIEQTNEQRQAGVDEILTKPFRVPQLMKLIWALLGRE